MQTPTNYLAPANLAIRQGERNLGRYDFEGGGFVQIVTGGDVDTEHALSMIQTLLDLKRNEINARKAKSSVTELGTGEKAADDGPI